MPEDEARVTHESLLHETRIAFQKCGPACTIFFTSKRAVVQREVSIQQAS
jgi:hypothetical protein